MLNRLCVLLIEPSFLIREGIKTMLSNLGNPYRMEEIDTPVDDLEKHINKLHPTLIMINPVLIPKMVTLPRDSESDCNPLFIGLITENASIQTKSKFDILLNLDGDRNELFKTMEKVMQLLGKTQNETDNNTLSERELSILKLVALGNTNNEIAERLFISTHTVMTHRKNITRKLGIKTVSGLTVYAILNQHIKMEEIQASE